MKQVKLKDEDDGVLNLKADVCELWKRYIEDLICVRANECYDN